MNKKIQPRGLRNNNPGNIRLSKTQYKGEVPSTDKSFKQFSAMEYGYRAMFCLLRYYQMTYHDDTIRKIVNRYAPPVENNTNAYVQHVCNLSGLQADERITAANERDMKAIVSAMSYHENGVPADIAHVHQGWELYKQDKL